MKGQRQEEGQGTVVCRTHRYWEERVEFEKITGRSPIPPYGPQSSHGESKPTRGVNLVHDVQAARDAAEADAAEQRASLQAQVKKALKHHERYLSAKVFHPYLWTSIWVED